jgi:hypothetical protein
MARKAFIKPDSGSPGTAITATEADEQWQHANDEVRKNLPPAVKLLRTLEGDTGGVYCVAFIPIGIYIWLPVKEEQRQIAAFLDTADKQITLLRTQRSALDQQKRGLMQHLLTGKLRVITS